MPRCEGEAAVRDVKGLQSLSAEGARCGACASLYICGAISDGYHGNTCVL